MVEALRPEDPREVAGYRLRGRLGSGGMGVVYLSHSRGGQPVALKIVRQEYAADPEFRRRFAREVEAARRVHGPYTVPVVDSDVEGPQPWLASAFVSAPTLGEVIREHGPLPVGTVLSLVAGISEALQSIHAAGVVHRDLKPTNVLLASDGPRVIDFGIARSADATALTGTDVRLGTPAYMSPEQVTGRTAGPEIDVFSLGMVAFFAATGQHPFGEGAGHALLYRIVSQPPDLDPCPEPLREVVSRCLAKDPGERPTPAEIIEMCRGSADATILERGAGWWLPNPVAAEVTSREQAPLPPAAPPPPPPAPPAAAVAPPATAPAAVAPPTAAMPPSLDATASPADAAATAVDAAGSGGPPRRSRTVLTFLAGALTALLVGGGTALALNWPGPGDGGRPKTGAGWELVKDDERLVIRPPAAEGDAFAGCVSAPSTFVDLDALTVTTDSNHGNVAAKDQTLEYMNCGKDGSATGSGLKLLDGQGLMGKVSKRGISSAQCRDAARSANIPNPVSIPQIRNDSVLRQGMGLCVETEKKNVVMLWIDRVDRHPDNHGLRTYVVTATQWRPKPA